MKMKISWSMQTAKLGTTPKSKITPELVSASKIVKELFELTIHNGPLVEFYVHELMSNYPEELPPSLYSWRILWTSTILLENIPKFHPGSGIPRKEAVFSESSWDIDSWIRSSKKLRRVLPLMRSSLALTLLHGYNSCASISADIRSVSLLIQF